MPEEQEDHVTEAATGGDVALKNIVEFYEKRLDASKRARAVAASLNDIKDVFMLVKICEKVVPSQQLPDWFEIADEVVNSLYPQHKLAAYALGGQNPLLP